MTKSKISLIGAIAIASMATSLVIEHRTCVKLREREDTSRQQDSQLAKLAAEHQRLSNLVVQANNAPTNDQMSELQNLRSRAETLRQQTNELGKLLTQNRRSRPPRTASRPTPNSPEYNQQVSQMAAVKPTDARNLAPAFCMYAHDHQNQVPSNLDQVAPYLRKGMSLTGTNEFDIVYQGSLDELKNIPLSSVALIRGRQAWIGPSGKMTRVYGLADGSGQIVASDDNFQSWEAEHVIPPPAAAAPSPPSVSPDSR